MQLQEGRVHETWSSRLAFLLAAIGAAVGLGNLWKFPYTAGVSGGGAFVLIYVGAIAAIAIPIVMAELLIGRRGRMSPPNSMRKLSELAGAGSKWQFVGWMNIAAVFLILTFYSVIAGWGLAYIPKLATGMFQGATPAEVRTEFEGLLGSVDMLMFWHALFMGITVYIVGHGIQRGIERAVKLLMPLLFLLLLILLGYAMVAGDFATAWSFLFDFDFSKITADVVLAAIGQAFFSVSVAMGLLMTYGAYLPADVSIPRASVIIATADTLVAILAGLVIFPIVFQNNLDPAQGPGLIFVTLPIAFGSMPAGSLFGLIFFILLVFAALTSSIAIMEPMVAWAAEHKGMRRNFSAMIVGGLAWLIGLLTVFSFNIWSDVRPLQGFGFFEDKTVFDLIDHLATNILLPLGGIFIAVFAGWVMAKKDTLEELQLADSGYYRMWQFLVRIVAPVAVAAVLVANIV